MGRPKWGIFSCAPSSHQSSPSAFDIFIIAGHVENYTGNLISNSLILLLTHALSICSFSCLFFLCFLHISEFCLVLLWTCATSIYWAEVLYFLVGFTNYWNWKIKALHFFCILLLAMFYADIWSWIYRTCLSNQSTLLPLLLELSRKKI